MKRKSPQKFTDNFKREAVNLVVEQGYTAGQSHLNLLGFSQIDAAGDELPPH
ncbi:hypothetical protein KKJ17_16665 [Xenorhabdus bovienii]|uniref:hypothetical protein n=1 Tax=Xenorhabdus bovienii TaxID=40576 RepID=UPI0023B33CCA|nr:hypothetical protein [Xenorhabdus bovienii]MDE9447141.1 hypothetical protein [Xenorhabdus bovienii]MDE9519318.1 hypothetical protein [Xenorhabdus bovienii]MDE9536411.1 hypothetical protein [Xenorhabdus bovienii]MDE9589591.1 hypothetical protein [Xenorhabdus bovienii]